MRKFFVCLFVFFGCSNSETPTKNNGDISLKFDMSQDSSDIKSSDTADVKGMEIGRCDFEPMARGPLRFVAAGAPEKLFGAEQAPSFEPAFTLLNDAGFDAFFPFFARTEIEGVNDVSAHFDYFLPASFGAPYHCGLSNPYQAADEKLKILFPAFLFSDATGNNALNEAVFRTRFQIFKEQCWNGTDDIIFGHETFDEIASQKVVNTFFGVEGPRIENVGDAYRIIKTLSDKPVFLVEGPAPELIRKEPLPAEQKEMLLTVFWDALSLAASATDVFGFDVYPIPNDALTLSGDYVRASDVRFPATQRLAVLQGFSRRAESAGAIDERGPTLEESRFMALDAIVGGATHLIWYGGSYLTDSDEDQKMWEVVLQTVKILNELNPWLIGTSFDISTPEDVEFLTRKNSEQGVIILINRSASPKNWDLEVDVPFDQITDENDQDVDYQNGRISIQLDGYASTILKLRSCP